MVLAHGSPGVKYTAMLYFLRLMSTLRTLLNMNALTTLFSFFILLNNVESYYA